VKKGCQILGCNPKLEPVLNIFTLVMSKICEGFSVPNCHNDKNPKFKRKNRFIMHEELKVPFSYNFEVSMFGF